MKTAECRSCGAPMIWAETANGKRMPVDADPVEGASFVLVEAPDDGRLLAIHVSKAWPDYMAAGEVDAADRYTSHFATCPDAGKFRR